MPAIRAHRAWLLSLALIGFLSQGCGSGEGQSTADLQEPPPINAVVVVDLSDRIKAPGQTARDTAVLRVVAAAFKEHCRRVGYPFSSDRFRIQLVRTNVLKNDLTVDVGLLNAARGEPVVTALGPRLKALVDAATEEYLASSDFLGADLWGYFKDDLQPMLKPAPYRNKIILMTDGYLNFEASSERGRPKNTIMRVAALRNSANWRDEFPKYALRGVGRKFEGSELMVLEIAPKVQPQSVNEGDILKTYWSSFGDSLGLQLGQSENRIFTNAVPLSVLREKLQEYFDLH